MNKNYRMDNFVKGKAAVRVEREDIEAFLKECDERHLHWNSGQNSLGARKTLYDKLSDEYDILKKKYEEGGPLIRKVVSEIPIVWVEGSQ